VGLTVRLFIAIEFPPAVKQTIRDVQQAMKKRGVSGRFVGEDNLHLTLQFLGEVTPLLIKSLIVVLRDAARPSSPFELSLANIGKFGKDGSAKVVWLGLQGNVAALNQLYSRIVKATAQLGMAAEQRPYCPHVTLARDVAFFERIYTNEAVLVPAISFEVAHFALYDSSQQQGKRVYTVIDSFPLGGKA